MKDEGYTAMHLAVRYGHTPIVQLLVVKGGDYRATDNNGKDPVQLAQEYERADVLKILPEQRDWTVLHKASFEDNETLVQKLLAAADSKININAKTADGSTPLHCAAMKGMLRSFNCCARRELIRTSKLPTKKPQSP